MIEITLPWPDKRLSPNSRCHWREKAEAVTEAKTYAFWQANRKWKDALNGEYQIAYKFYPPDRRKRDQDNCLAMMKAAQDGV